MSIKKQHFLVLHLDRNLDNRPTVTNFQYVMFCVCGFSKIYPNFYNLTISFHKHKSLEGFKVLMKQTFSDPYSMKVETINISACCFYTEFIQHNQIYQQNDR